MSDLLKYEIADGIATITLNRPAFPATARTPRAACLC